MAAILSAPDGQLPLLEVMLAERLLDLADVHLPIEAMFLLWRCPSVQIVSPSRRTRIGPWHSNAMCLCCAGSCRLSYYFPRCLNRRLGGKRFYCHHEDDDK